MAWLAVPAGIAWGLSVVLTALAVRRAGGRDAVPHPVAAWSALAFAVCAIPAMLATGALLAGGPLVDLVTLAALLAVAGLGVDALLRVAEPWLPFAAERQGLYLYGIGFVAFHLWIATVSIAILVGGALPAGLGWLGVGTVLAALAGVAVGVAVMDTPRANGPVRYLAAYGPQVGVVAWMVWLGLAA